MIVIIFNIAIKKTMEVKRLRTLAIEIFKNISKINSKFMKPKSNTKIRPFDIIVNVLSSRSKNIKSTTNRNKKQNLFLKI